MDARSLGCHREMWRSAPWRAALSILTTGMAVILMHRDTKLGLALAILVMGFAAALCFPRQPSETHDDLTLRSAADLDEAIRLMPVKSYTDADRPQPRVTEEPPLESTAALREADVFPLAGVPDPIQIPREPEPTPIDPGQIPAEMVVEQDPEPVVHSRTYRALPNDTLSGIARSELGDGNRWKELLSANPLLQNRPENLRPGMDVVIPIPADVEVFPLPNQTGTAVPETADSLSDSTIPPRTSDSPTRAPKRFSKPTTRIGLGGAATIPQ